MHTHNNGIIVKRFADDIKVYLEIVNATDTEKQGALDLICRMGFC